MPNDIYEQLNSIISKRQPKTPDEKHDRAVELVGLFNVARSNSELFNWIEAGAIYHIIKNGLHNYLYGKALSQKLFFEEIDIPVSTATMRAAIWEFYVVKHKFSMRKLKDADWFKLNYAMKHLRNKSREGVEKIIEIASRGHLSRDDFKREMKEFK